MASPLQGTVLAERSRPLPHSGPFLTWLLSTSAIGYEFFIAIFVGLLVAALLGYWPLPIGFEIVPVILMGAALWNGFFTRAQTTDLIRLVYSWKPSGRAATATPTGLGGDPGGYEVVVSYGIVTSHNRSKAGFQSERRLDRIDPAPASDPTVKRVLGLLQYFTGASSGESNQGPSPPEFGGGSS